ARTNSSAEVLMMALEPSFLRYAAHDLVSGADRIELRQSVEIRDPMLRALGASLRAEMAADYSGGRVYGETLASTLAVYLVRHYGEGVKLASAAGQGLNRQQLRRATEFIAENLAQNVSLGQIAAAAGLSAFHFARLFKKSTGMAPHQYVIRCRVERARQLMLANQSTMADIAHQVGFCDQSHLTTHFKRVFGVTPRVFRRRALGA
ncbi:MAG TPA: AraC family transcriptional regulator, partial [Methylomirabilota bacterium]|nr:AraC family transcriptional regulator [Methylomirabilota bacterium]